MEIKSETNDFDINKVCRTCLVEKDVMQNLFVHNRTIGQSVAERIMAFTNVQLEDGDGLPSLICLNCVHQVNTAFSFKQLCEQSDMNLRQYLLQRQPVFIDINKQEKDVESTDYGLVDNFGPGDSSHNSDKDDKDGKDFLMCTVPVSPANIKQEDEVEAADYEVVGGDVDRFGIDDSSKKFYEDDGDGKDFSIPLVPIVSADNMTKEENVVATDCKIEVVENFGLDSSSDKSDKDGDDGKDFSTRTAPDDPADKKAVTQKQLKKTMKQPFLCNVCGKKFKNHSLLVMHIRIHTGDRPFPCNKCQKQFITAAKLKLHMGTHTNKRPFVCEVCDKGFTQSGNLKRHKRSHETENPTQPNPIECDICQKRFTSFGLLKNHKQKDHRGERPYVCKVCGYGFPRKVFLQRHAMVHLLPDERPFFSCEICQKKFTTKCSVKIHMSTHTNERPFACKICGKAFKQRHHLTNHKQLHGTDKPIECNICQKRFSVPSQLKYHMRKHTGERPYVCNICERGYTMKSNLQKHLTVHSTLWRTLKIN